MGLFLPIACVSRHMISTHTVCACKRFSIGSVCSILKIPLDQRVNRPRPGIPNQTVLGFSVLPVISSSHVKHWSRMCYISSVFVYIFIYSTFNAKLPNVKSARKNNNIRKLVGRNVFWMSYGSGDTDASTLCGSVEDVCIVLCEGDPPVFLTLWLQC